MYLWDQEEKNAFYEQYENLKNKIDWGRKLSQIKQITNRSFPAMAEAACYSYGTVQKAMEGEFIPSCPMLVNFVRYLHVNPEWLFIDDSESVLLDGLRARDSSKQITERIKTLSKNEKEHSFIQRNSLYYYTFLRIRNEEPVKEPVIRKIADNYNVGFEWLLCGDVRCKENPCRSSMIEWLWANKDVREVLWKSMNFQSRTNALYKGQSEEELIIEIKKTLSNEDNIKNEESSDSKKEERSENNNSLTTGIVKEETFGDRIHQIRVSRNCSLRAFSEIVEVGYTSIQRWEKNIIMPEDYTIERTAENLDVGVDWLKNGNLKRKNYPCDRRMIEWLKEKPEVRRTIAEAMKE